jgi:FkbM family methyltransferase
LSRPRTLPRRIARSLAFHGRRLLRRPAWRLLGLKVRTASGLTVPIRNQADWILFDDIFVKGDYDPAISELLDQSSGDQRSGDRRIEILDLGANVGFFTLRTAQRLLEAGIGDRFRLTLVEGSPRTFRRLRADLAGQEPLRDKLELIHGLVGRTEGAARIAERSFHATNRIVGPGDRAWKSREVPYHDLRPLWDEVGEIDLLNCEVEGAEEVFLESYRSLLPRVRLAVFELHHDACDTERCRRLLAEAGLAHVTTLVSTATTSLELFGREPATRDGAS